MAYSIKPVEVYATDTMNRPGMLARILEALAAAGANLEFVIARRVSENTSRAFVAPLRGAKVMRAAADVGLVKAAGMHAFRIEGPDRPGLGAKITRAIAAEGINVRGLSAASIKKQSVTYIAFATKGEMASAMKAAKKALASK
jgi:hypothetical protein